MFMGFFKSKKENAANAAPGAAKQEKSDALPPQLRAQLPEQLHTVRGFVQHAAVLGTQSSAILMELLEYCRNHPVPANIADNRNNLTEVVKVLAPHVGATEFAAFVQHRQLDLARVMAQVNPSFTITKDQYALIGRAPDMGDRAPLSRLMLPRISG